MKKYSYYLELAVQQREAEYVYNEGEFIDSIKNFIKTTKEATSNVITALSKDTEVFLKDLSPTRTKLKRELMEYQSEVLHEYEQTLQNKLKEEDISINKQKNKKWYQNQLLKQEQIISTLDIELKNQISDYKNQISDYKNQISDYKKQIKQNKQEASKLTRKSATEKRLERIQLAKSEIEKRLERIQLAKSEIEKKQKEFNDLREQIDTIFKERDELLLSKKTATEKQISKIDEQIKNKSRGVTKLVLAAFFIFSYLINFFINKYSGFY